MNSFTQTASAIVGASIFFLATPAFAELPKTINAEGTEITVSIRDDISKIKWEDQYITEIIDPKTGEVLPDGEYGEVVFTSLTREAMPIIRYRTHDISRILSR